MRETGWEQQQQQQQQQQQEVRLRSAAIRQYEVNSLLVPLVTGTFALLRFSQTCQF